MYAMERVAVRAEVIRVVKLKVEVTARTEAHPSA